MNNIDKQQQFVSLRAEGKSFAHISEELGISKPTLIKWSRKFQFDIQNQRAILLEHIQEKWLSTCENRIAALGEQLKKIEAELAGRDIVTLTTNQLFTLAESLRRQIKREIGPMQFTTPISDIPDEDYQDQVQDWTP